MSDAKAKDQGDQHQAKIEAPPLQAPDAQTVRLSGHVEMNKVEQARTNASDGSLRHYQRTNLAGQKLPSDWHEQNRSLELQDGDISISRVNPIKEANLASPDKRNANGKPYQVYTAEVSQALQKPGEISRELTQGEYQSTTKLNVQITNVPEVSPGLNPQEAIKYVSTVMDTGVAAVRQVEHHMTEPGAINRDIENTANHLKQSPFQFEKDVLGAFLGAVDKLDKPMTAEQRASAAGALMPMFFFEGGGATPIDKAAVNQMKLDQMTAQQLKELGIKRVELHMPEVPSGFEDLELTPADPAMLAKIEKRGIPIRYVEPGSEDLAHLKSVKAQAAYRHFLDGSQEIILPIEPRKIQILEEFLHSTQRKLGLTEELATPMLEVHVKDFIARHHKLLGLSANDLAVIEAMKREAIEILEKTGYGWKGSK
ncbi:MAG: hypothetical protein QG574_4084 [Cyanobacteriota bacterium erpe_2018_sw_21hr_WHONDRS-SW48-000092_B_bin.40]|jgi:hypothetical protein|nr:hypothetical protein [Cyanobacteriota bacterium erpe_2018_sw_21hr_WHONDRS-SW48-000092_B_bin.40]